MKAVKESKLLKNLTCEGSPEVVIIERWSEDNEDQHDIITGLCCVEVIFKAQRNLFMLVDSNPEVVILKNDATGVEIDHHKASLKILSVKNQASGRGYTKLVPLN